MARLVLAASIFILCSSRSCLLRAISFSTSRLKKVISCSAAVCAFTSCSDISRRRRSSSFTTASRSDSSCRTVDSSVVSCMEVILNSLSLSRS